MKDREQEERIVRKKRKELEDMREVREAWKASLKVHRDSGDLRAQSRKMRGT